MSLTALNLNSEAPSNSVPQHLGYSLVLFLLTIWWIGGFTDGFIGHPYGDMPDHVWGNEWFAQELRQGRFPYWVRDNHFPTGGVLWHIDPLGGLFRRLFLFLPPHWVWNSYVITLVFGFAWSVLHWAGKLGSSTFSAFMLGVIAICNPYMSGLIHSGLTEYMGLGFGVLFAMTLSEQQWWKAGLWLMILGLQSFVVGLIATLFGVIQLFYRVGIPANKDRLWIWVQVALPSLCVVVPFGLFCLQTLHDPNALFTPTEAPGWNFHHLPAVDLAGFVPFGDWVHPDTRHLNPGIVQNHAIGWGWLTLVLIVAVKAYKQLERTDLKVLGTFLMFAIGPRLSILRWMPFGGAFLLPLAVLYSAESPFRWVHHPYHLVMFVWIASIPIVALATKTIPKWVWTIVLGITVIDTHTGSVPVPLVHTQFQEDIGVEGPRLDFPPDHSTANRTYLIQQLRHREPIAYGVNQWIPGVVFTDPAMQRWLRLLDDPVRRSQNRDQPPKPLRWEEPTDEATQLRQLGFEWVVVHWEYLSDGERRRLKEQLDAELGVASIESPKISAYRLDFIE